MKRKYIPDPKHTILLAGPINHEAVITISPLIATLETMKLKNGFRIRIVSPGGEASACLALYDILKLCKNKVIIEAFGECSSAAAVLLQAADERWVAPHCRILIHNGAVDAEVESIAGRKLVEAGQEVMRLDNIFCDIFAMRSGTDKDLIKRWLEAETYFNAHEAVANKLADWVITK